jgi:hypothetical protein
MGRETVRATYPDGKELILDFMLLYYVGMC